VVGSSHNFAFSAVRGPDNIRPMQCRCHSTVIVIAHFAKEEERKKMAKQKIISTAA
jgi:hypothetical protein